MRCARTAPARPALVGPSADANFEPEQVNKVLAQLSERQRAVIYRSYCLGWTTTQIAAELRTDDGLVKQHLHNALHALRIALLSSSDRPFG